MWEHDSMILNVLDWPFQCLKPALIALLRRCRQKDAEAQRPSIAGTGAVYWQCANDHISTLEATDAVLIKRAHAMGVWTIRRVWHAGAANDYVCPWCDGPPGELAAPFFVGMPTVAQGEDRHLGWGASYPRSCPPHLGQCGPAPDPFLEEGGDPLGH